MHLNRLLSVFALFACLVPGIAGAQVALTAVRVWPAPDYTRLTLESPSPLRYTLSNQPNPARLVLELQNVQPNTLLETLPGRIGQDDPLIARAEVQRARADGVRIV